MANRPDEAPESGALRVFVTLPSDARSWIVAFVATAVAYLLVSHGLMSLYPAWQVPLFVGAIAGLAASSVAQAGVVAGLVATVALLVAPLSLAGGARLDAPALGLGVVLAALAAIAVASQTASLPAHRASTNVALSSAVVIWLLVSLWAPLFSAGFPPTGYGSLPASTLREIPPPHQYVNDDALYLRVFNLMHDGEAYYSAYRDAWRGLRNSPRLPNSAAGFRLPTLFWIWRLLPNDALWIVAVFLAFASLGVIAAALITGQLVGARFAPLAAAAVAAYAMGSAISVYVTYVDLPATCVVLAGVALYVRALRTNDPRLLWGAAAAVTFGALMREILVYVAVLSLLASLIEPAEKRLDKAAPWLVSLAVFSASYGAHTYAVRGILDSTSDLSYLHGGPSFVLDSLVRFSDAMNGRGVLLIALFSLGLLGAIASSKRVGRPFALFATAALVAPLVAMLRVGNPGIDAAGNHINYWGNLFVPLALALWPAWVLVLPSGGDTVQGQPPTPEAANCAVVAPESNPTREPATHAQRRVLSSSSVRLVRSRP